MFFPPTPQDLPNQGNQPAPPQEQQQEEQTQTQTDELLATMPDVPTTEPKHEGQPDAKRAKIAPHDPDDEWVDVEKPEEASTGLENSGNGDEEMVTVTKAEMPDQHYNAAATIKSNDVPSNTLAKDW